MTVLGLGHDVVDVDAFREQCLSPGSVFVGRAFCQAERLQCKARAQASGDDEMMHLAARWAGKEAVLKAWCEALGSAPYPYTLDGFDWSGIRIVEDARHRPHVEFSVSMVQAVAASVGEACGLGLRSGRGSSGASAYGLGAQDGRGVSGASACRSGAQNRCEGSGASACGDDVTLRWHISLSHDGQIASAIALLERV
jgi:holo-[acyl-carrier protein] synthase